MTNPTLEELASFHDNSIYGFSIVEGEQGTGDLIFDLDHITGWKEPIECETGYRFMVAPAFLTFKMASELEVSLNYANVSAGMQPFSVSEIEREEFETDNGYKSSRWTIRVNWPEGLIKFKAPHMELVLRSNSIDCSGQYLSISQRRKLLDTNNQEN